MLAVPLAQLEPHPLNPRTEIGDVTELARSIREQGLLQPLLVEQVGPARYRILIGHRRHAAAGVAGLTHLPCLVASAKERAAAVETMVVENVQRVALTPLEQAQAFDSLRHMGRSVPDIARRTGLSVGTVQARLLLLDLPADAQQLLAAAELSLGDAVTLARQVRRTGRGEVRQDRCKPHLQRTHPLADPARLRCDLAGHPEAGRLHGVACERCFEDTIRADERGEIEGAPHAVKIDQIAVERACAGDRVPLGPREREAVVAQLNARHLNDQEISRLTGISDRTVIRARQRLGLPAVLSPAC
jgi:ParB family chromosome partitioning protein